MDKNTSLPVLPPVLPQVQRWSRAFACICFEVRGPEVMAGDWSAGPLPVPLPDGRTADRRARASYFQARAADALYGSPDGTSPPRWHQLVDAEPIEEGTVLGIELLRLPRYCSTPDTGDGPAQPTNASSRYLCVLHLALDLHDPLASLATAVRLDASAPASAQRRQRFADLAGTGLHVAPEVRRALSISIITAADELRPPPCAPSRWTSANGWLWVTASATPLQQFTPDADDPHVLEGLVYLSSAWRALVLRDGVGFLGLVPDRAGNGGFFDWGESYVRSLYTDVALLAAVERDALDSFANRLAHIGNRFEKSRELRQLVNEVTEFRNIFWWETITRHGNANVILEQLHAAHRTPRLFARVIADLDAFRQQVEAQALEASVQVQQRDEGRSRRFEHAVSVAAVTIALPALVFAALTVPVRGIASGRHDMPFWLMILIGLVSMLIGAVAGSAGARWISRNDGHALDAEKDSAKITSSPARSVAKKAVLNVTEPMASRRGSGTAPPRSPGALRLRHRTTWLATASQRRYRRAGGEHSRDPGLLPGQP